MKKGQYLRNGEERHIKTKVRQKYWLPTVLSTQ